MAPSSRFQVHTLPVWWLAYVWGGGESTRYVPISHPLLLSVQLSVITFISPFSALPPSFTTPLDFLTSEWDSANITGSPTASAPIRRKGRVQQEYWQASSFLQEKPLAATCQLACLFLLYPQKYLCHTDEKIMAPQNNPFSWSHYFPRSCHKFS
jgi:hypothetical protein